MAKKKMKTKIFEGIDGQIFIFTSDTTVGIVFGIAEVAANPKLRFFYSDAAAMLHAGIIKDLEKEGDKTAEEMVAYILEQS